MPVLHLSSLSVSATSNSLPSVPVEPEMGSVHTPYPEPRLLADIGATYARFCLEQVPGRFDHVAVLPCADYPGFIAVMQAYLDALPGPASPPSSGPLFT